jgi:hypothetical protein
MLSLRVFGEDICRPAPPPKHKLAADAEEDGALEIEGDGVEAVVEAEEGAIFAGEEAGAEEDGINA